MRYFLLLCYCCLTACTGVPENTTPITHFELNRYLGTWYEIARFDHSFEKGLSKVSAHYSLREDGGVNVLNKGFDAQENTWQQAQGKAYFVSTPQTGHFKVSFWGPFYSSYVILALDPDYQWALVSGYNKDYLWILARSPQLDDSTRETLIHKAKNLGFNTHQFIWVEQ